MSLSIRRESDNSNGLDGKEILRENDDVKYARRG